MFSRIKLCRSSEIVSFGLFKSKQQLKRYKTLKYCLPKGIIANYEVINGKNFYDQPNDSDIREYTEIKKLTTG